MTEERKQTFSEFCMHMYAENCHERREYGQKEYMSVEAYVDEALVAELAANRLEVAPGKRHHQEVVGHKALKGPHLPHKEDGSLGYRHCAQEFPMVREGTPR